MTNRSSNEPAMVTTKGIFFQCRPTSPCGEPTGALDMKPHEDAIWMQFCCFKDPCELAQVSPWYLYVSLCMYHHVGKLQQNQI